MKSHLDQEVLLENAIAGASYHLKPLHRLDTSRKNLKDVTTTCNEKLVYEWCFRGLCKGKPYPQSLASDWIKWGTEGWDKSTHFVYVVTDADGTVAAAIDIKSADLERAEIGYWSSSNHRGIMTNAVLAVVDLADKAGFRVLFADIHPENRRSLAVIRRCGFLQAERESKIHGHTPFDRYHPGFRAVSESLLRA